MCIIQTGANMRIIFRGAVVIAFLLLALPSRAQAQMAGTLDLQTHCERALAGIRLQGDMFQLPVAGGDAYQCFGFIAAIQQLSTVYIQAEGHTLTRPCTHKYALVEQKALTGGSCPPKLVPIVKLSLLLRKRVTAKDATREKNWAGYLTG